MATFEYRYEEPIISPGYGQVYRDGVFFAWVYAQYGSVMCPHREHPEVKVGRVMQSDCPEILEVGRDELVRGVRAVMAAHHDAEEAREQARLTASLNAPRRPLPPDVQRLFDRYGGMRAIMADDLPSDRADEAEDPVAAQRLREYRL